MRLRYVFFIGAVIGAVAGYWLLWQHLAGRVEAAADAWIAAEKANGREVTWKSREHGGFPYRLSLTFRDLAWSDSKSPIAWRVESAEITAYLQLWNFQHVIFLQQGTQSIAWRDGAGAAHRIAFTPEKSRASLVLDGAGEWQRFAADIAKPVFAEGPETLLGGAAAEQVLIHLRRGENAPPSTEIALQIFKADLPKAWNNPLGLKADHLRLIGAVNGASAGSNLQDRLATWREGGGVVNFETVDLGWGPLGYQGSGTLALDRQFRPLGAMAGRMTGMEAGVDALVSAGLMRQQDAAPAKAALAALAQRGEKGAPPSLTLPFSIQDGVVSLGPVPLAKLAPILPAK